LSTRTSATSLGRRLEPISRPAAALGVALLPGTSAAIARPPTPTLPHEGGGSQKSPPPLWGRVGWGAGERPGPAGCQDSLPRPLQSHPGISGERYPGRSNRSSGTARRLRRDPVSLSERARPSTDRAGY